MTDIAPLYAPKDRALISVSVVGKTDKTGEELVKLVKSELATLLKIDDSVLTHLKSYQIDHALPILDEPIMEVEKLAIVIEDNIYLAGDHLTGGSLNGAMISGRQAVEMLEADIKA